MSFIKKYIDKLMATVAPHRFQKRFWEREAHRDHRQAILTGVKDDYTYQVSGRFSMAYLFNLVPVERQWHVLDYGCGNGRVTRHLARKFKQVTGADISEKMLQLLRKECPQPNITPVLIRSASLKELKDHAFDLIFSMLVLQHMNKAHARQLIGSLLTKLKPGGYVFFQFPSEQVAKSFPQLYASIHQNDPSQPGLARIYNLHEIQQLCTMFRLQPLKLQLIEGNYYLSAQKTEDEKNSDPEQFSLPGLFTPHFRAKITPLQPEPIEVPANQPFTIQSRVENCGNVPWWPDEENPINYVQLGVQLLNSEGEQLVRDFGRAALPAELYPGRHIDLSLACPEIVEPAPYRLLLDMVNEANFWFHQHDAENGRQLKLTVR